MEVKLQDSRRRILLDATDAELEKLDEEFNKLYKYLGSNVVYYSLIWEIKDKINMAVRG